jgi:hypothetical protein
MTGLNPAWVFISLLVGARAAGLIGVVVAVPIAVVIKTGLMSLRSQMGISPLPMITEVKMVTTDTNPPPVDSISNVSQV